MSGELKALSSPSQVNYFVHTTGAGWNSAPDFVARLVLEHLGWCRSTSSSFRLVCKDWNLAHDGQVQSLLPRYWQGFRLKHADYVNTNSIPPEGRSLLNKLDSISSLDLSDCRDVTDQSLRVLSTLTQLRSLDLFQCNQVTEVGACELGHLTGLTSLNLKGCCKIKDEGLKCLQAMKKIQYFGACENIEDAGFTMLHKENLTCLDISSCQKLTALGLATLSEAHRLQGLDISKCYSMSDETVTSICQCVHRDLLTSINFGQCLKITNSALQAVSSCTSVTSLNFSRCTEITDDGMVHLQMLPDLKTLDISRCGGIRAAGLTSLSEIKSLVELDISKCRMITEEEVASIKILLGSDVSVKFSPYRSIADLL